MARVGTRLNPGSGGMGISLALGGGDSSKKQEFELRKQREAQWPTILNNLSERISDPAVLNKIREEYFATGYFDIPTTKSTPRPAGAIAGTEDPYGLPILGGAQEEPFSFAKPVKTRGIALVDKSGGQPKFMQSPFDELSTVDYGVTPTKPAATDIKDDLELKKLTNMVKAAQKKGALIIGGTEIPTKTKEDITLALGQYYGRDPSESPELAAAVDMFPESEPKMGVKDKFMQWWSGAAKVGNELAQPSNNSGQTRQYNGFTYRKEADGKWHKLK